MDMILIPYLPDHSHGLYFVKMWCWFMVIIITLKYNMAAQHTLSASLTLCTQSFYLPGCFVEWDIHPLYNLNSILDGREEGGVTTTTSCSRSTLFWITSVIVNVLLAIFPWWKKFLISVLTKFILVSILPQWSHH